MTMSPHAIANKRDVVNMYPPPLKINKDSHFIKKSSSSSSSSPSSSASSSTSSLVNAVAGSSVAKPPHQQQQQRHPVIIYTHSPKIIHTHPRDFMALVQKLTGLSRFEDDAHAAPPSSKPEMGQGEGLLEEEMAGNNKSGSKVGRIRNDHDNDSSSVITSEENCSNIHNNNGSINNNNNVGRIGVGGGGDGQQVNSCFVPPNPYIGNIPVFTPNAADFLCSNSINHLFTTI